MAKVAKKRRRKLQAVIDNNYNYRTYKDKNLQVKVTGARGHGLFARRQFVPGELIVEIGGQVIPKRDYRGSRYVMDLSRKWFLEPDIPGAFVNHSCSPNCELIELTRYTLGLVALCNIEKGREICYDYRWPALDWIPVCKCGAPNCRGWVVADDQIKKMKRLAKSSRKKAG